MPMPARGWSGRVAARLRPQTEFVARADGGVAGTYFCWRSDSAYVAVLWKQARMVLPIAAVLRPDLDALSDQSNRRLAGGLGNLIAVGRRVAILPGFLSPRLGHQRGRWRRALSSRRGRRAGWQLDLPDRIHGDHEPLLRHPQWKR